MNIYDLGASVLSRHGFNLLFSLCRARGDRFCFFLKGMKEKFALFSFSRAVCAKPSPPALPAAPNLSLSCAMAPLPPAQTNSLDSIKSPKNPQTATGGRADKHFLMPRHFKVSLERFKVSLESSRVLTLGRVSPASKVL